MSPHEQIRWTAVVKLALENAESHIYPLKEAAEKFAAAEKAKLTELAGDPVRLAVLHRSATQHGHTSAAGADRHCNHLPLFLRLQRLVLAERSEHHQSADPGLNQRLDMSRRCVQV